MITKNFLLFSTKAQTLENLSQRIKQAYILPIARFLVDEYRQSPEEIILAIQSKFKNKQVIVRSSAFNEDCFNKSNAGCYRSVLNVSVSDNEALKNAIEQVIKSYDKPDTRDEIFIQVMLQRITSCGVAFTADINTLAPYYIINYDEGGKSDTVTGGKRGIFKSFIQVKQTPVSPRYPKMARLVKALAEIEAIFDNTRLDIEFAFTTKDELYILQVRPIVTHNKDNLSELNIKDVLFKVHQKVAKLTGSHPNLLGHRTVFGVMPDWNPAEIIGLKPKQLSLSLYKELFTDNVWAYQRDNYGYRNLRSHPLLVSFIGIPFIDVRVDFNSFIPKILNESIAKKLAEFYINKLIQSPSCHDKVEFEIVHSCFYFNLRERLCELKAADFSPDEIKQIETALLDLTNRAIDPTHGLYKEDLKKIEALNKKYEEIVNSDLDITDKMYWLIEDCKRYGTLPFAGIARAAFIAMQLLYSMVDLRIISKDDFIKYMNSLDTITNKMHKDLSLYSKNQITRENFLRLYGHLRPGTYDIMSLRYDEDFEHYFSNFLELKVGASFFSFTAKQRILIEDKLKELGLTVNAEQLFVFIKEAIEGREYSKYVFTRSLSKVLQLAENLGAQMNMSREEMSFVDIKTIINLYAVLDHRYLEDILKQDITKNMESYNYTKAVKLPSLIVNAEDIYGFYLLPEEPNFITLKKVRAQVIREQEFHEESLEKRIVFVQSADPGYDWMFSRNICGFVTKFGGANSHMAVRASELGIPAVIGAGEFLFNDWIKADMLEIDCANRKVTILK